MRRTAVLCPFTCQFDLLSDQFCQSCDRLFDHFKCGVQLFRLDDREVRRQQVSSQLGVDVEQLKTLPRALRQAAASGR